MISLQGFYGSSSSLGASPKSSSGYLQSTSLSSDLEESHSPSSTNGSLNHLEVRHPQVMQSQGAGPSCTAAAAESTCCAPGSAVLEAGRCRDLRSCK